MGSRIGEPFAQTTRANDAVSQSYVSNDLPTVLIHDPIILSRNPPCIAFNVGSQMLDDAALLLSFRKY